MLSAEDLEKQFLTSGSKSQQSQQQRVQHHHHHHHQHLQQPIASPPRRDTPHPSEGITDSAFGSMQQQQQQRNNNQAASGDMSGGNVSSLHRNQQQQMLLKQMMQQQDRQNTAPSPSMASPMRSHHSSSSRTPSSPSSPHHVTKQHHISQPKSPSKSSLEQITPKDFEYVAKVHTEQRIPTQITTLTLYESDPKFQFGHIIATNPSLMVYGLRAGLLRTMNRYNGTTALFSAHKRHITDIAFKPNSNVLASASQDKTLVIWNINPDDLPAADNAKGLDSIALILKQPMDQNHAFFKRIAWDATRESTLIALKSDNSLVALNVESLVRQAASNPEKEMEFSLDLEGVQLIAQPSDVKTNDICFSRDSKFLVTGDDSGVVRIYDVAASYALKKSFSSFHGSIFSVNFCGGKHRAKANSYLVVGGENNSVFKVWNLSDLKVPMLVQSVTISASGAGVSSGAGAGSSLNILNQVQIDEYSQYLFAANMLDNALFVLHLNENTDGEFQFDSVSEFLTESCIVSYTTETRRMDDGTFMFGIFCMTTTQMGLIHFSSSDAASNASKGSPRMPVQSSGLMTGDDEVDDITIELPAHVSASTQQKIHHPHAVRASPGKGGQAQNSQALSSQPQPATESLKTLEKSIISQVSQLLQKERFELRREIEIERQRLIQEDHQRQQELLRVVSETLAQDVPDQLAAIVDENMNETIVPGIKKNMDALTKKLSKKVEESMRKQVQDSFKESFNSGLREVLLPSFEKMVGSMLEQLSRVFASGIEEQLKRPLEKYYKKVNEDAIRRLEQQMREGLKDVTSLSGGSSTQGGTSVPTQKPSPTDEILSLLQSQEYEQAFARVLSVHDADFVLWTCKQANPDDIFEKEPVPLSQAVILSLMQQISFDFSKDVNMKLDWIQKAALALNPQDSTIAHHVLPVLGHVHQQILNAAPNHPQQARKFKMTSHVINSLMK
uniref:Enhancer of mRNA-decapping protein 4 C-terminal domain-containing protein n=1 Tax=Percolomonas cosmopolitus TaxID=63605 RepID=A0A6U0K970_9EUKA